MDLLKFILIYTLLISSVVGYGLIFPLSLQTIIVLKIKIYRLVILVYLEFFFQF